MLKTVVLCAYLQAVFDGYVKSSEIVVFSKATI